MRSVLLSLLCVVWCASLVSCVASVTCCYLFSICGWLSVLVVLRCMFLCDAFRLLLILACWLVRVGFRSSFSGLRVSLVIFYVSRVVRCLLVVGCWLLLAVCWFVVVGCMLVFLGCLLSGVGCWLFGVFSALLFACLY